MSYDKAILIGNITRQPEMKYTPSGVCVCEFGIAINKKRKGEDKACFLDVVSFNKTAKFVQKYFQKGSEILIDGEHEYDMWDDKDTGKKRSKVKIIASRVDFVGSRQNNANQQQSGAQGGYNQDTSYQGEHNQAPQDNGFPEVPQQADTNDGQLDDEQDTIPF